MQIRSLVALAASGAVALGGAVALAQTSSAAESAQSGVSLPQQWPTGQPTRPRPTPTWPGMPGQPGPGQPTQPAPQPPAPAPWPGQPTQPPAPQPPAPQPPAPAPWPGQPGPGQPTQPAPAPQPQVFVKEVSDASWATDVVENSKRRTVIVDYYTTWCGACKAISPWLAKEAEKDKKWMMAKIDAEKNPKNSSHVRAYPEIEAWQRGTKAERFDNSNLDETLIRQWLDRILPKGPQR